MDPELTLAAPGNPVTGLIFAGIAAVVSIVLLIAAALLERSGPIRLRGWAEEANGRLLRLHENIARFDAYRFLLSSLARLSLLTFLGLLYWIWPEPRDVPAALWALLIAATVAVGIELLNRFLVADGSEAHLRRLTMVYRGCEVLFAPLVPLLASVPPFRYDAPSPDDADEEEASDEEIQAFIDVGTREGILEPNEAALVRGVVDFGETLVRSVMTPRIDIVALAQDATLSQAVSAFSLAKHTRLPVFADSVDQIVGVLHVLDVIELMAEPGAGERAAVRERVKPPLVVPETKALNDLLREFQATGQQMAIVVNEHGSTAGIVTMEDLLEEIVGEISDEYGEDTSPEREELPGGVWRLEGGAHVETLGDLFGLDLEDPPFETVGGLVMSVLGTVPRAGDVVDAFGLRFVIERVAHRRVERLRVERAVASGAHG